MGHLRLPATIPEPCPAPSPRCSRHRERNGCPRRKPARHTPCPLGSRRSRPYTSQRARRAPCPQRDVRHSLTSPRLCEYTRWISAHRTGWAAANAREDSWPTPPFERTAAAHREASGSEDRTGQDDRQHANADYRRRQIGWPHPNAGGHRQPTQSRWLALPGPVSLKETKSMLSRQTLAEQLHYAEAVRDFFQDRIEQVFLYITNRCDLRCAQCFYKEQLGNDDMSLEEAKIHSLECAEMGATKITLLGGEPSMYDIENKWEKLGALVHFLSQTGFRSIRLDTNGQFDDSFIDFVFATEITDLSFSLDGGHPLQNDSLRGKGSFHRATDNISRAAQELPTSVTICVSRFNLDTIVDDAAALARQRIDSINFHPLLPVGNHQDLHIRKSKIEPQQWKEIYRRLKGLALTHPAVKFRVPPRFAISSHTDAERYCSIRSRDRVHIQPNGQIRICALSIGSQTKTCALSSSRIELVDRGSEISLLDAKHVCAYQRALKAGNGDDSEMRLCISYKPTIE